MKLMIVLSRFPLPARKGDKLRAWEQIKGLASHFEIHLVCLADEQPEKADLAEVQQVVHSLHIFPIPVWKRIPAFLPALFQGIPFQVAYFSSGRVRKRIEEILVQENIPICYVQLIRLGQTVPILKGVRYFLDYMDALSSGMANRIPESRGLIRFLFKMEAGRLARYEAGIAPVFHGYSAITEADARLLPASVQSSIHIIPNGVSDYFFETQHSPNPEYDLVFTGNMGYFPNVKAAIYLVEEIVPLLEQKFPNIRICLAGTDPSEKVRALQSERVTVTGFVPDMRDILGNSRLFVAPLFTGSGLQNKLLESMAAGLAVLTTPLANEALRAPEGEAIRVCRDAGEFAHTIATLLAHPEDARKTGLKGQEFVRKHYGWQSSNQQLAACLKQLIS